MITLFRKIRQRLVASGSVTKYLLYAIGEILLVVVGILIALQVNNWNEERISRSYELTMLSEVNEVLIRDAEAMKLWLPELRKVQYSFNRLAAMKDDPEINVDSLEYHLSRIKGYGIAFTINKAPFEAIKSGGLDRITNTEIRNKLSNLYGFSVARTEEWINEVHRVELFKRNDIIHELIETRAIPVEGSDVTSRIILDDPKAILTDPRFDELLERASWPLDITISLISEIYDSMSELNQQIEIELGK